MDTLETTIFKKRDIVANSPNSIPGMGRARIAVTPVQYALSTCSRRWRWCRPAILIAALEYETQVMFGHMRYLSAVVIYSAPIQAINACREGRIIVKQIAPGFGVRLQCPACR
jgi:hypothetical protein